MDRRTFVGLAVAGIACGRAAGIASAAVSAQTDKRYRIGWADYKKVQVEYLPQLVEYSTAESPGTLIVDSEHRFLYLVLGEGTAKRYGVGVGREGFGWSGIAVVKRKTEWPTWVPPQEMIARDPKAARWPNGMPGGPDNPLGARALYLYQGDVDTLMRIHGTPEPVSIGRAVSSGCIRMLNADVIELYDRVPLGTKVVVLGSDQPIVAQDNSSDPAPRAKQEPRLQRGRKRRAAQARDNRLAVLRARQERSLQGGPVEPSLEQQQAVRTALEHRRRRRTIADWLRSLDDSG
jgi:lipoprotein-anchoring transpeptidase ErfK/SrfK